MTKPSGETRPATILSPHGEGYCRTCRFVVGLDIMGVLDQHERSGRWGNDPKPCKGGGRRPPKLTPYASAKSRFSTRPPRETCPVCKDSVVVMVHLGDTFARHWTRSPVMCAMSGRPVPRPPDVSRLTRTEGTA